jgi:hypothetical protein
MDARGPVSVIGLRVHVEDADPFDKIHGGSR